MGEILGMLSSMDPMQLGGIAAATVGLVAFVGYKLKSKKKKVKDIADTSSVSTNDAYKTSPKDDFEPQTYTVNTEDLSKGNLMKPKGMNYEIDDDLEENDTQLNLDQLKSLQSQLPSTPSSSRTSADYLEEAITYDVYNSKEDAKKSLRKAYELESNKKEKMRFHVLFKTYSSPENKVSLNELLNQYPSFLDNKSVPQVTPEMKTTQDVPVLTDIQQPLTENPDILLPDDPAPQHFAPNTEEIKMQELPPLTSHNTFGNVHNVQELHENKSAFEPVETKSSVEDTMNELAQKANELDSQQFNDDNRDKKIFGQALEELGSNVQNDNNEEDLMTALGALGQEIHRESAQHHSQPVQLLTRDVWVNLICMNNGRTNFKDFVFHLDNAWGSKKAVLELKEKIVEQLGKDANGNPVTFAIISIVPLNE